MRYYALLLILLLAACEPRRTPPPAQWFEGLPVRGSKADAQRAGFTDCIAMSAQTLRCRRHGVMLLGQGPYVAAVDLLYSDGSGGFDALILWHDRDQNAVATVGDLLEKQGWHTCRTGPNENQGDQEIYTKAGALIRFSMDLSYWGKRRLRLLPELNQPTGRCW